MINFDNQLKMLVDRARGESSPRVDVSSRVIAVLGIKKKRFDQMSEKSLMWVAVLSSALAASVMIIAMISYFLQANPLTEISETISWVMQ